MPEVGAANVRVRPDMTGFTAALSEGVLSSTAVASRTVGRSMKSTFKVAGGLAAAAFGGAVLVGVVKNILNVGAAYQRTMAVFQRVTNATSTEMANASTVAQQLGNDMNLPGVSAATAADAMVELGKAGLTAKQSIDAAHGALALSVAGETSAANAAMITANALLTFGLRATEAGRVTDLLAGAANASSASMTDIAYSLSMGGAAAKTAGIPIQDMVTSLTILANAGIRGSDAGTVFKTAIQRLTAPTKKASDVMKQYGISMFDAHGNFVGMRSAVGQLSDKLGVLNPQQKAAALNTIFGARASRFAAVAMTGGVKTWDKMSAAVNKQGQAAALAKANNAGLGGALDNLQSTAEGLGLSLYLKVAPALQSTVRFFNVWMQRIPAGIAAIKSFISEAMKNETVRKVVAVLSASFASLASAAPAVVRVFHNLWAAIVPLLPILKVIGTVVGTVLLVAFRLLSAAIPVVVSALATVLGIFATIEPVLLDIIEYVGILAGVVLLVASPFLAMAAAAAIATAATTLWSTVTTLATTIAEGFAVAVEIMNAAWLANPIGVIIVLIIALAAAIYVAYQHSSTFRAIVAAIGGFFAGVFSTGIHAVVDAFHAFIGAIQTAWSAVTTFVSTVVGAIAGFVAAIAGPIGQVVLILTLPFRIALAIYIGIWSLIIRTVIAGVTAIVGFITSNWTAISNILLAPLRLVMAFVQTTWALLSGYLSGPLRAASVVIQTIWAAIEGAFTTALNFVKSIVSAAFSWISSVITGALNRELAGIKNIWAAIKSVTSAAWNAVYNFVAGPVNRVRSIVSSVFSGLAGIVSRAVSAVGSAAGRIGSTITSHISGIVSQMAGIGSNIVHGLINGITGMAGALAGAIKSFIANNVPGPVRKLLKLGSPSKLFEEYGRNTAQGLINGMVGESRNVAAASASLATTASVSAQSSFSYGSVPTPTQAAPAVRVFIGDRELTDIVRTEVDGGVDNLGRQLTYGRRT